MRQPSIGPVASVITKSSLASRSSRTIGKKKKSCFRITASDSSIFPSYTNLTLPYSVICRQRYWNTFKEQQRQFISEVAMQELLQAMALDGVRVHREFCQYIFSKPSSKEKITMTNAEERRLMKIVDS